MPDMALIAAVLTSIKAATDIAKGLREADLSLEKAELKLRLADLMTALADARIAITSVQDEVVSKDREIRNLQEKLDLRMSMTYAAPFYWQEKDGKRDGPFCQQCYDSAHKTVRLQAAEQGVWTCKACENVFVIDRARGRQTRAITDFDPRDF